MKKYLLLVLVLVGCNAQVEDDEEHTPAPVIECGWNDIGTCTAEWTFASQQRYEELDNGATACFAYHTLCVTKGTPVDLVPDECRREIYDCQPVGPERRGGLL